MSGELQIKRRLEEALQMVFCLVSGCWPMHGCRCEYVRYEDCHALEVWPVGFEEETDYQGNGHLRTDQGVLYELAEFDFTDLSRTLSLENLHFSQQRRASQLFKVENLYDGPPSPSLAVFVAISNDRRLRRAIVHPVQIKQLTRPGQQRQMFEISWREFEENLEVRIHIAPLEP